MLPNRFPDADLPPEYNAVDASLWYVVAAHEFLGRCAAEGRIVRAAGRVRPRRPSRPSSRGYAARHAPRHRVGRGRAAARRRTPGVQLTWMDAKAGDRLVTPRIGKPVEFQALWINALRIADLHGGGDRGAACARGRGRPSSRASRPRGRTA